MKTAGSTAKCNPNAQLENRNERIAFWDNIKFVMVLLMVIGHFAQVYYDESDIFRSIVLFIYAFHMPVFMFISGLFFNRNETVRRSAFYICCGLVLKLSFSLCDFIMGNQVSFWLLYEGDIPWFMFTLGYYGLLMLPLTKVNHTFVLILSILLSCMIGYDTSNADYLVIFRTIVFFPFYYVGTLCQREKIESLFYRKQDYSFILYLFALVVLIIWGIMCFYKTEIVSEYLHVFKGRFKYSEVIIRYGILARLLCYLITTITGSAVMLLCPHKKIKWLTSMGSRTINVYFWHWIMYKLCSRVFCFQKLFYTGLSGKIAYLCIAVGVCCITASVNMFNWPMNMIKNSITL